MKKIFALITIVVMLTSIAGSMPALVVSNQQSTMFQRIVVNSDVVVFRVPASQILTREDGGGGVGKTWVEDRFGVCADFGTGARALLSARPQLPTYVVGSSKYPRTTYDSTACRRMVQNPSNLGPPRQVLWVWVKND